MKNFFLIIGLCFLVAACSATPYQKKDYWGIGYNEAEIEPGVFFLEYTADEYSSMADAVRYWHQRAKALCNEKEKKGYEMIDPKQDISSPYAAGGVIGGSTTLVGIYEYPRYTAYLRCTDNPKSIFEK